jgi:hypothetical protein
LAQKRAAEVVDMASLIAGEGKATRRTKIAKAASPGKEAEMSLDEILEAADELDAMLKLSEKGGPLKKRSAARPVKKPTGTKRQQGAGRGS